MIVKGLEKKEKNTAELTVEITAEEFEAAVQKAYLKGRGRISIPGFRKGKAPRKMIESIYGAGAFYEDAVDALYPDALNFGVQEEKLDVVGRSSVLDVQFGEEKTCEIKFLVSLYPEVKLGQYKGIAAPKATVRILKKDVDHEIDRIREQNARVETVDREAKNGDIVNINFLGSVDSVPFEGGQSENQDLELGSGNFIPGFEDQIVGHKAGEEFDINVTFPDTYTPELAGKAAVFAIKVNEVKEKQLPELDDEFAKDVSEFDTLEEYAASVKEKLSESRKADAQKAFEDIVLERLVENVECEIPDAMLDEQVDTMLNNFAYQLASQGIPIDTYMEMTGSTTEMMKDQLRPVAEKDLKSELALEAIVKAEKLEPTQEELDAEYERLSGLYGMDIDGIKQAVKEETIKNSICIEAARKLVFASAVVEKKDKKDKAEDKAE